MWYKVKIYPSDNKFKFGVGQILKSLYVTEISILLAGEQITIKFDVADSDIPLLLGKNTIKQWNLTINTGNDTAWLTINDKLKEVKLYIPAGALIFNHVFQLMQWVLFSVKK